MENINLLSDFELKDKRVLLRVDLNVPVRHGKVVDSSRIERVMPTIEYLQAKEAKIILLSHFGRPKGKYDPSMSLAPIVDVLNNFLAAEKSAKFCVDAMGSIATKAVDSLAAGEVLLLENLRFYQGEENNEEEFARQLSLLGDIYINDTFSCSHRAHASIAALPKFLPSGIGLLFQEELSNVEANLIKPQRPFAAIIGGSKISTKLNLLENLVEDADILVIGGGMANSFLKAQNINIGKSICEDDLLEKAKAILAHAKQHNCQIILPQDVVIADGLERVSNCEVVRVDQVPDDKMILDLGPYSTIEIINHLKKCKTIVWNGPLGAFEYRPFNVATETIARAIALHTKQEDLLSVAGGGDVVAALSNSYLQASFTYLSTAGGAFLEWLEGKESPGIRALQDNFTAKLGQKSA